jgi:hypothetical protein
MIARESQFLTRAPAKFSFSAARLACTHLRRVAYVFFGMLELCVARFVMQIFVLSWSERQFGKWAFSAPCVCALVVIWLALMMSIDGFFPGPIYLCAARTHTRELFRVFAGGCTQTGGKQQDGLELMQKIAHCFRGVYACAPCWMNALIWCSYFVPCQNSPTPFEKLKHANMVVSARCARTTS